MVLGRLAPEPTELSPKGSRRLSASLSEWMMGWPDGWVTAVPGLSRNDQLRVVGNGVVPHAAAAALRWLLL
jgi:DNA (cytosine-5)-methyltransferase 1